LLLLLWILASIDVVEEEIIHAWLTEMEKILIPLKISLDFKNLRSRSILLELVFVMRLVLLLLLIPTISTENYFVLNDTRVCLKMRQCTTLTKRPLSNVINVPFHQCQVFPSKAKATSLSPNVSFARRMSNLTRAALTSRKRFSGKQKR
jgi:hypothetical protein